VGPDGVYLNYTGVTTCLCTYCDKSCPATTVNGYVGFFDGCNWLLVSLVYLYVILFSIIFNVFRNYYQKKEEAREREESVQRRQQAADNSNQREVSP
jgi:hypothetical protein